MIPKLFNTVQKGFLFNRQEIIMSGSFPFASTPSKVDLMNFKSSEEDKVLIITN